MRNDKGQFVKGYKTPKEIKDKISNSLKGKPARWIGSEKHNEICAKISKNKKGVALFSIRGDKHYNWKGNMTDQNMRVRNSVEYKLWRRSVFERDKYMCIFGGKEHGNKLNADHIKPFAEYPELRFAIDNGRTLCIECHKKVGTWGRRRNTNI